MFCFHSFKRGFGLARSKLIVLLVSQKLKIFKQNIFPHDRFMCKFRNIYVFNLTNVVHTLPMTWIKVGEMQNYCSHTNDVMAAIYCVLMSCTIAVMIRLPRGHVHRSMLGCWILSSRSWSSSSLNSLTSSATYKYTTKTI